MQECDITLGKCGQPLLCDLSVGFREKHSNLQRNLAQTLGFRPPWKWGEGGGCSGLQLYIRPRKGASNMVLMQCWCARTDKPQGKSTPS